MAFQNQGPFPPPETMMSPDDNTMVNRGVDQFNVMSNGQPTQGGSSVVRTLGMPTGIPDVSQYQALAAKLSSPYNTMQPNSWLAQNHPVAAGIFDHLATIEAMTPGPRGPEGVGGGISRTFEGLVGAQNLTRQRQVQQAMLPYQLMMPQLQAANLQSEIGARNAEIPYRQAMETLAYSRANHYDDMIDQGKVGTPQIDKKGQMWVPRTTSSGVQLYNALTNKPADPNDPPVFQSKADRVAGEYGGGAPGRIIAEQLDPDPDVQARGIRAAGILAGMQTTTAGGKTAAEQNAPHPQVLSDQLVQGARATIGKGLTPPKELDWMHSQIPDAVADYKQKRQEYDTKLQSQQQWVDSYVSSGASKKGVSYSDWVSKQQGKGVNTGAAASSDAQSNMPPAGATVRVYNQATRSFENQPSPSN
jgi:hypothetical protein